MRTTSSIRAAIFTDTYHPNIDGVTRSIEREAYAFETYGLDYNLIGPSVMSVTFPIKAFKLIRTKDKRYCLYRPIINISEIIDRWRADVVHIHTPFSFGLLGLNYAKQIGAKILYTHHTNYDAYLHYFPILNNKIGKILFRKYINWFIEKVNTVIVPSQSTLNRLLLANIPAYKMIKLPTPLDEIYTTQPQTRVDKAYDMLFVGRLSREKNLDLLIDVIQYLINIKKDVKIAIVGDGIQKAKLLSSIECFRAKNIRYFGELNKNDLLKIYRQSKLLFLPSVTETQGLIIQEAFSQGVPIIGITCEQSKEFICHEYNGLLLPAEPKQIATAIHMFLQTDADYQRLSQNCSKGIAEFSTENWYKTFVSIII
jgi:1,2-diacylglycerol 3-alpha-glucosyltransferase